MYNAYSVCKSFCKLAPAEYINTETWVTITFTKKQHITITFKTYDNQRLLPEVKLAKRSNYPKHLEIISRVTKKTYKNDNTILTLRSNQG